jgi:hypothetical protein
MYVGAGLSLLGMAFALANRGVLRDQLLRENPDQTAAELNGTDVLGRLQQLQHLLVGIADPASAHTTSRSRWKSPDRNRIRVATSPVQGFGCRPLPNPLSKARNRVARSSAERSTTSSRRDASERLG